MVILNDVADIIPVDQTTFGVPGGNCLSACIASILQLGIEEVPYFMSNDVNGREWITKLATWLVQFGLYPVVVTGLASGQLGYVAAHLVIKGFAGVHILQGPTVRGGTHAVVGVGNTIIHDPHPSRAGLVSISERTLLVPYKPHLILEALDKK